MLAEVAAGTINVQSIESSKPSPFAATLLFNYTANFLYEGDAPHAERQTAALTLDLDQLRELLGQADFRAVLDAAAFAEMAPRLQRLGERYSIRHADALHEALLQLGDLSEAEVRERCARESATEEHLGEAWRNWLDELQRAGRVAEVELAGERRFIAAEDVARYRDATGATPPSGLAAALLEPVANPLGDLVSRYARTHLPFRADQAAARFGVGVGAVIDALQELASRERVVEGEFTPDRLGREWCDADVLQRLKQISLARARRQVEPVDSATVTRFLIDWHGIAKPRQDLDGLLDTIEQLQGLPLAASLVESEILAARVADYQASDLDELLAAGEVVWQGCESVGAADGRVALFLADDAPRLATTGPEIDDELESSIVALLEQEGAVRFETIHERLGGFRNDLVAALWRLVWSGVVTNDTFYSVAVAFATLKVRGAAVRAAMRMSGRGVGSVRDAPNVSPEARGDGCCSRPKQMPPLRQSGRPRWRISLSRGTALSREKRSRLNGFREGFRHFIQSIVPWKRQGDCGAGSSLRIKGLRNSAQPQAADLLRRHRDGDEESATRILAATDPANPYGALIRWPPTPSEAPSPQRTIGARVFVCDGRLIGYLNRTGRHLTTFIPSDQSNHSIARTSLVAALAALAQSRPPVYLEQIDGRDAALCTELLPALKAAGFTQTHRAVMHAG